MQRQFGARHLEVAPITRLRAGDTLRCITCTTSVVLMDVPVGAVRPACCGQDMITARPVPCSTPRLFLVKGGAGAAAGIWYADANSGLVVRCTRSGRGYPVCSGRPMSRFDDRPDTALWA
jgi:hypothetical protein